MAAPYLSAAAALGGAALGGALVLAQVILVATAAAVSMGGPRCGLRRRGVPEPARQCAEVRRPSCHQILAATQACRGRPGFPELVVSLLDSCLELHTAVLVWSSQTQWHASITSP